MIEYTINKKQFLDFHFAHIKSTNCYKRETTPLTLLILLFSFLIALLILILYHSSIIVLITFLIVLNLSLNLKKIHFKLLKNMYNQRFSENKYKYLFETSSIELVDSGIKITTVSSSRIYKWAAFKSLHIINDYIFIRTYSNNSQLLIPFNFISTPEERSKLFNTIEQNTNLKWRPTYPRDIEYL
ncbi:hypothetical protein rsdtw13_34690 [Clostridium sp. TW13]|uniref:Uncharacterized protein n=1 Tax=Inconstantimicrobium mannanitabidum TaxID=1604901 RepID=A0ACB5RGL7_9CLOT|nr:hypothetical protein rsdtw13_34690 [Clostridium sp. TW13]